jgi:hypothetical protein
MTEITKSKMKGLKKSWGSPLVTMLMSIHSIGVLLIASEIYDYYYYYRRSVDLKKTLSNSSSFQNSRPMFLDHPEMKSKNE